MARLFSSIPTKWRQANILQVQTVSSLLLCNTEFNEQQQQQQKKLTKLTRRFDVEMFNICDHDIQLNEICFKSICFIQTEFKVNFFYYLNNNGQFNNRRLLCRNLNQFVRLSCDWKIFYWFRDRLEFILNLFWIYFKFTAHWDFLLCLFKSKFQFDCKKDTR